MNEKSSNRRAKKFDTPSARRLIFTLAVSSTLGFWALFSRVNQDQASASEYTTQTMGDVPPVQVGDQVVLDLPPMPTLIPVSNTTGFGQSAAGSTPTVLPTSPALEPGKIFFGGAPSSGNGQKIERNKTQKQKAVTSTRSSR